MKKTLTRSEFNRILFATLAVGRLAPLSHFFLEKNPGMLLQNQTRSDFFSDPFLLRLGKEYLRLHPNESTKKILEEEIFRKLGFLSKNDLLFRSSIINRIRSDFQEEDSILLEGWVLSRTEGKLLAWNALNRS